MAQKFDQNSVDDAKLRDSLVYSLEGINVSRLTLKVSPGFESKPKAWKISQHIFLEASRILSSIYVDATWYMIVDSDTIVYKLCLMRLLSFLDPFRGAIVLANVDGQMLDINGVPLQRNIPAGSGSIMGGAGTIWSHAANIKVNFEHCINETLKDGSWQHLNSDWRLTRCFDHFFVPIIPIVGMYQFQVQSIAPWCPSSSINHDLIPQCIISEHYVTASAMEEKYITHMGQYDK